MKNQLVADIFNEIADLLEIKGDNPFRIRAYRKAALNVESLTEDIEKAVEAGTLTDIPGIGEDLALKITEIVKTGKLKFIDELKREIPAGVLELMQIPGVGPKTAKLFYDALKIKSVEDLEQAARKGKLQTLPGIREKTVENILHGIELVRKGKERMPLGRALPLIQEIMGEMKRLREVSRAAFAGSTRRMKETVRDLDLLVTSTKPSKVMDAFVKLPHVQEVIARGETKSSVLLKEGINMDLRVVEPDCFGAALCYFTGSKSHNIKIRSLANRKGLKVSEYGVFVEKTNRRLAGREEEDVYKALGLAWVPPEIREDQGEIEAALKGNLPHLVELKDIRGDFHTHTKWSDGGNSIEEMVGAAAEKGYEYMAICDHSKTLGVAHGLSEKDLFREVDEIRGRVQKKFPKIRILCGTEMEILGDGALDYKDDVLKELDFVVASVHSGFKSGTEAITNRVLKAMDSPYVNVIAHPTGRLMGQREGYELDFDRVFERARQTNTHLEINAYPARLDLTDILARRAREAGAPLVISTDAHATTQFDNMLFGVSVARRAWCEKKEILNTCTLAQLLKRIKKK